MKTPSKGALQSSNHGLPRGQTHPEMMQDAADCHHQSADTLLPQADPVFDHTTALHTAVDRLDPETAVVQGLVGPVLRQRQLLAAWLFGWMELSRCRQGAVVVHGKRRAGR